MKRAIISYADFIVLAILLHSVFMKTSKAILKLNINFMDVTDGFYDIPTVIGLFNIKINYSLYLIGK